MQHGELLNCGKALGLNYQIKELASQTKSTDSRNVLGITAEVKKFPLQIYTTS